jgi:hypothetical protein
MKKLSLNEPPEGKCLSSSAMLGVIRTTASAKGSIIPDEGPHSSEQYVWPGSG